MGCKLYAYCEISAIEDRCSIILRGMSDFGYLTETAEAVEYLFHQNARRQVQFKRDLKDQTRRFVAKQGKDILHGAKEKLKKLRAERYFFDVEMMGHSKDFPSVYLRNDQTKAKKQEEEWKAKPWLGPKPQIDCLGQTVRNVEKEYLKSCITDEGLTARGRRDVFLPPGWTECTFFCPGNQDHGKTYFAHELQHLVTFKLPVETIDLEGGKKVVAYPTKLCELVFKKFGTLFLKGQKSNGAQNEEKGGT